MRKQTLAVVAYLVSVIFVYGVTLLLRWGFDWSVPGPVAQIMSALLLAPLVLVPLSKLNQRLLTWRKNRGRDIQEEERYENVAAGLISLRPASPEKDCS